MQELPLAIMEISLLHKRVVIPIPIFEYGLMTNEVLKRFFCMDYGCVKKAIKVVVGEDIFQTFSLWLLYPSQVASCFLLNVMELL